MNFKNQIESLMLCMKNEEIGFFTKIELKCSPSNSISKNEK
jgi:hypothetical protein